MDANVSTRSIACQKCTDERDLPRTLMGGSKAMMEAGEKYTPKYDGESYDSYKARTMATKLYNGFEDTVRKTVGKILSKDVVIGEDVPETITELMTNVDGQGRNLTAFTNDALKDAMVDGISFIFVDFPKIISSAEGEKPTLKDQLDQKARPNAILYDANQILGFKHRNNGGTEELTEVRIFETIIEPVGEWGEREVNQVRLMRVGSYELWRVEESADKSLEKWFKFEEGPMSLPYIPVVPIYTNRVGYMLAHPPLKALAELNLEHWISSSDQRKALTFARFAMAIFTGVEKDAITKIGPDQIICLREPDAKWGKVETSGEGITAGRQDLQDIQQRMQSVGMVIQVQSASGDVTATAASINSEEANSASLAIAGALEDSLDQMLKMFGDYLALPEAGSCRINKQFGRRVSTATVGDFVSLFNAGLLDDETILTELQARGDLSEDLDIKKILSAVKENMPTLLGQAELDSVNNDNPFGNEDNGTSKDSQGIDNKEKTKDNPFGKKDKKTNPFAKGQK